MTSDPSGDEQPDAEQDSPAPVEEIWAYAGRREIDGKRYFAWQDGRGKQRYYAKVPASTVGGTYALMVTREGERAFVAPDLRYTGQRADEQTRREMEALDIAAAAILAAKAR